MAASARTSLGAYLPHPAGEAIAALEPAPDCENPFQRGGIAAIRGNLCEDAHEDVASGVAASQPGQTGRSSWPSCRLPSNG